jgi:membrane-bound lytic murein transglycosylase C
MRSVNGQARLRRIDPALVLAMMQTESNFNPRARSSASAMGLMQLVPTSGGREAYRFVYGRDRIPTARELYDPDTNIALGVGYLHLLMYEHFGDVRDPESRLYCTIAGYHTGPSNVARAFVGRRDVEAAVARVNQMSPDAVKQRLLRRLPYRSTRVYLETVLRRLALYRS